MKYDVIEIEKENVPYSFKIELADETFQLGVGYNETAEFFTLALSKLNAETGEYEDICDSEPIIYGRPLWKDVYRSGKFPAIDIIPMDESAGNNAVTYDNMNITVFLIIDNQGDEVS